MTCLGAPRRERSVGIANHLIVLGFRVFPAVFDAAVTPLVKIAALSRRPVTDHSGSVLSPVPDGEAEHGWWDRFGRRRVATEATSPAAGPGGDPAPMATRNIDGTPQ